MNPADVRELDTILRLGIKFRTAQRAGRRPGFLQRLVNDLVARVGPRCSFDELLELLDGESARRDQTGAGSIEQVSRVWELVTYHDPGKGRRQVPFDTLRNKLTRAKKRCSPQITVGAKP